MPTPPSDNRLFNDDPIVQSTPKTRALGPAEAAIFKRKEKFLSCVHACDCSVCQSMWSTAMYCQLKHRFKCVWYSSPSSPCLSYESNL